MPTSIQTSKFGTLDTSGRVPVFLSGEGADLKSNFGLGFTINGTEYIFMPEDRVQKGTLSGNNGSIMAGFLNPDLSRNLQDKADYVDLANTQFGSWDAGNFIANQLGGSTKGYIAPKSAYQPIFDAGLVKYDASLTGPVQGIGQVDGKPVYFGSNGYVEPSGKYNYQQAIGQKIVGYTYSTGGGMLAQLGNELNKISPVIGYASIAYLTAVTGGALGSALMSSGAMTSAAAASAAATAAGATTAGAAAAGAAATAAATAVGTAVASVTAQVAMGVPVETAVKNAAVNAVVQTQMPGITAQIQQAVDSPAVASALANASTSYAATVAKGGTADDAAKNALAGAAGSITQNLTGSKSAADAMKVIASGGSTDKAAEAAALAFFNEQVSADAEKKRKEAADAEAKQKADAEASAQKAAIEEQNRLDAEASAQQAAINEQNRIDAETSARQAAIAEQNRLDAEAAARQAAIDEQNRLDEEAKKTIGALPTEPTPDDKPEPPSALPTEPTLDNELEEGPEYCAPGFHWNGSMCVADEDVPPVTKEDDIPTDESTDPTKPTKQVVTTKPPTSPLPTTPQTPTTTTGGLPTTTTQTGIPWLDTKPQMLETKKAPSVMNPYEPLRQLYDNVDPTLMNVLADRGISPQGYAEGSSVSSLLSQFSSDLDKSLPKFAESRNPFLSMGSRKAASIEHAKLPQLKPGLTGHAKGGLPDKYAKAAPKGHNPEFITGLTGFYANGKGTGQSDDIPAMLHDGDYVMDADTVAALGDGSSKAGALTLADFQKQVPHEYKEGGNAVPAKIADGEYVFPEPLVTALGGGDNKKGAQMLDAMREEIRAHKRSAPTSKIPPKAKSPLDYLKMVKG
jgi:hypothetical protein